MSKLTWTERKQNIKEDAIVWGGMAAILLPLRYLIVTFLSNHWLGSFGLLSAVSIIVLVLAKKNKLGRWGKLFLKQMQKNQRGKRAILIYGEAATIIILMTGTIFAISEGNTLYAMQKQQVLDQHPELKTKQGLMDETKGMSLQQKVIGVLTAIVLIPILTVTRFGDIAVLFAIVNDASHGLVLSMYTIGLIEYCEMIGILIFYRFTLRQSV